MVALDEGRGVLIAYFFAPFEGQPRLGDIQKLRPESTLLIGRTGTVALERGAWPLLGPSQTPEAIWRIPVFRSRDPITGAVRRVIYDGEDLLTPVVFTRDDDPGLLTAPESGGMGTGFVETRLTDLSRDRDPLPQA
jgi:hypothetical protein